MDLPVYTKQQLALRNGQDKPQIWVAYKGFIYDMTVVGFGETASTTNIGQGRI